VPPTLFLLFADDSGDVDVDIDIWPEESSLLDPLAIDTVPLLPNLALPDRTVIEPELYPSDE